MPKISYSILTLSSALLFSASVCMSMPARQSLITLAAPDGSRISAIQHGDENFHYYVSETDGALMIREGDTLYPADISGDGRLIKSDIMVNATCAMPRLNAARRASNRISGVVEGTTFPSFGKRKVAVVLVEYQDVKFNLADPLDYFTRMLNEEGFSDYHATGSARDWFIHSSNGIFEPQFDVYGPVTLQQRREYYGGSDAYNHDRNPQRMVIEACRQLNADVDFTQYDCDKDGVIDNVFVVYADRGEASGGSSDCVWPHAWTLSNAEPGTVYTFDGVRLDRYACCNEWELSDLGYGYRPAGIGSFVHEFSHVMGLPDLYSTEYVSGSFTAGAWSAMDYGPYNNDCCTPPQYSAWERAALGFAEIPELSTESTNLSLPPLENGGARLIKTDNENEYFIIENRQQSGWDEFIPGHGMLVWHIDYDADIWKTNRVNNDPKHNRIDIIEADNIRTNASRDGDSFPGSGGVTEFGASTTPAFLTWNGKNTGFTFSDISERNGNVLLRINGGTEDIATPEGIRIENIHAGYFEVVWQPVADAKGYTVRVYTEDFKEIALSEVSAETNRVTIGDLSPATDYTFTVCSEDGLYGSLPSTPLSVRTLEPTFDYFAPVAHTATDVTETSFTANWDSMNDAREYFVTVYQQEEGENIEIRTGFDEGAENLPDGWNSTSKASYGMASYCGQSTPALRLSKDGEYLEMGCGGRRGASLSFWHRGNATSPDETISVSALSGESWQILTTIPVNSAKGGETVSIDLPDAELQAVRICFNRKEKGALAIDDVCLKLRGDHILGKLDNYNAVSAGNATSLRIENLEPGIYYYDIFASDGGEYTSLRSEKIKVDLTIAAGVEPISKNCIGIIINGLHIETDCDIEVYDLSGRLINYGHGKLSLPAPGFYIIRSNGTEIRKIFIPKR